MQQQSATVEPLTLNAAPGHTAGGRVLVVAPQPFYEDRGTPIAVRYVLEALTQLGYVADVLTYPVGSSPPIPGVEYHRCANPFGYRNVPIGLSARKLVLDALLTGALARMLRRREYIAIHAVEEMAFPALALARRRGVPVIYDMQSSLPEQLAQRVVFRGRVVQAALRRAERWLLGGADMVMSSAGLAGRVDLLAPEADVREWHFPSRLQPVRPDEVAALRRQLNLSDRSRVVLYAGTFEKYQGLDFLIDAVAAVRRVVPEMVLLLVGGREKEVEAMQRFGQARGINGALRVIPRQPRDAMAGYFALADVLVSSRAYGGNLPLKIFDYLAAGRPIVASDIETHRAVLDSSRARLVPSDAAGLADGILAVLTDPDEAARLALGARTYAATCLGWDQFLQSIRELYGEIGNGG
jgi:glycosyltransferase involved in cell wall biosynthesis